VEPFGHGSLTCWKHRIILTASLHDLAGARSPVLLSPLSSHIYASVFSKACNLQNESCQQWIHSSSKLYHFSKCEIFGPYMNSVSNESIPSSYFSSCENCGPWCLKRIQSIPFLQMRTTWIRIRGLLTCRKVRFLQDDKSLMLVKNCVHRRLLGQ
jgi:hypothetical protein